MGVLHYIAKEWIGNAAIGHLRITWFTFLLGIDKCWDLYHMECVGLERPPPKQGIVTIAIYSHNSKMVFFQTKP